MSPVSRVFHTAVTVRIGLKTRGAKFKKSRRILLRDSSILGSFVVYFDQRKHAFAWAKTIENIQKS